MEWLDAIKRSKPKKNSHVREAKRRISNGNDVIWIYVRKAHNKKGYLLRQLKNGRKTRLDFRYNKHPSDFKNWLPSLY